MSSKVITEIVIKVNYGDTLRRFSVLFNQDGSLGLDMSGLRAKIFYLFKFAPDADITLRYVDEDNDIVTLVDDADLRDAIKQRLDPLRITVSLKSDSAVKPHQTGNSIRFPRAATTLRKHLSAAPKVGRYFSGIMDPVAPAGQQPSHEASSSSEAGPVQEKLLSTLVCDLASTVASHAPEKYCDFIAKLSQDVSKAISPPAPIISELVGIMSKLGTSHQGPASKHHVPVSEKPSEGLGKPEWGKSNGNKNPEYDRKVRNCYPNGCQVATGGSFCSSSSTTIPLLHNGCSSDVLPSMPALVPVNDDLVTAQLRANASATDPFGENIPFNGLYASRGRSHANLDYMGRAFHQGVRCDGCGVHPIIGPRYKSKVKDDYDLCSICFSELGDEADYMKMDYPLSNRSQRFPKFQHTRIERAPLPTHGMRRCGFRSSNNPKIDSRFIEDVNIVDGTLMAPLTPFTKIWRMHNNGAVVWPRGTQLVWIGGSLLANRDSFEVQLPSKGGLVGTDVNVAIDFTAPEQPGRYISYWRMASPSGQEFGQCVWVVIQVDTPRVTRNLNLNLPPDSGDSKDLIDVNVEPLDSIHPSPHSNMTAELAQPIVDGCSSKMREALCINDGIVNSNENSLSITPEVPSAESNPTIVVSAGSSAQATEVPTAELYPKVDVSIVPSQPTPELPATENAPFIDFAEFQSASTPINLTGEVSDENSLEQSLLKELDEMGFKEIDLNKEILRVNEYDLDRALDELCDVAEWDPMLEELHEMGFDDKETNKKLLIKNGGSLKRVVMDLIAAEKA